MGSVVERRYAMYKFGMALGGLVILDEVVFNGKFPVARPAAMGMFCKASYLDLAF